MDHKGEVPAVSPIRGHFANIILTGFMGTGKSSVGREVARRLGRPFVDMDAEIEARTGKSIASIFAQEGEPHFRSLEAGLCRELSARRGLVIATGGGALIDEENRRRMSDSGLVICLTCQVEEMLRRLAANDDRPLLASPERKREIERLLARRRAAYEAILHQIDTTGLTVDETAEQVIALWQKVFMTGARHSHSAVHLQGCAALSGTGCSTGQTEAILSVRFPGGEYAIHLGEGLLAHLGELLPAIWAGGREKGVAEITVAVVSNPTVWPLYGEVVEEALRAAGFNPQPCLIPDGERYKTLETVAWLYQRFLESGLDRSGVVLALGGGVVGDVAGFAAATYMRGLPFVSVPTTLLAMVDASVGGKTGVDLPQGKNLVGAFKQPALVAIDPSVLNTLPEEEWRCGLAEVVKTAVIGDAALFEKLEAGQIEDWGEVIRRALAVKIAVVEEDPFEQGWRAVLNLGHTVGHALERLSNYQMRHGEAVSIGLVAAARLAAALGCGEEALVERISALLARLGLPVRGCQTTPAAVWEAMGSDKKKRGRTLRWILPQALGQVEIVADVPRPVVLSVLEEICKY